MEAHEQELCPGIQVKTKRVKIDDENEFPSWKLMYFIESTAINSALITFDLKGSSNIILECFGNNTGQTSTSIHIGPYQYCMALIISPSDPSIRSAIKVKYTIDETELDAAEIESWTQHDADVVAESVQAMKPYKYEDFYSMDVLETQAFAKTLQTHFVNEKFKFPPIQGTCSWRHCTQAFPVDLSCSHQLYIHSDDFQFRTGTFDHPVFLSILAVVGQNRRILTRMFPFQSNYDGKVFHSQLCIRGKWKRFVLDGFFPSAPGHGACCTQSDDGSLWVPLVEKTFAQNLESYDNLHQIQPLLALEQLSGAACTILWQPPTRLTLEIWKQVAADLSRGKIVLCHLTSGILVPISRVAFDENQIHFNDPQRIFHRHLLSAIDGAIAWNELGPELQSIATCDWSSGYELRHRFGWKSDAQASCMFLVSTPKPRKFSFTLYAQGPGLSDYELSLSIVKITDENQFQLIQTNSNTSDDHRPQSGGVHLDVLLTSGEYLVVPRVVGYDQRNSEAQVEDEDDVSERQTEAYCRRLFQLVDSDMDGKLSRSDFKAYLDVYESCSLEDETFRWMLDTFDCIGNSISYTGFKEMFQYMANDHVDTRTLLKKVKRDFKAFDITEYMILSVQCPGEEEVNVSKVPYIDLKSISMVGVTMT